MVQGEHRFLIIRPFSQARLWYCNNRVDGYTVCVVGGVR